MATSKFGTSGYLCEVTPSDDGKSYHVVVSHPGHEELSATKDVKASAVKGEHAPASRTLHEELVLPIIEELEDKRLDLEADEQKEQIESKTEQERDERKASKEYKDSTRGEDAEDGTGSNHSGAFAGEEDSSGTDNEVEDRGDKSGEEEGEEED
jgi:hypothetical protein